MESHSLSVILLKLLAVAVLVLLNAFFVAAEFALVKVRDTQLDPLIAKGNRVARVTRRVLANLDASLSACQLGITMASLALGWVGEPVFSALLAPVMDWLKIGSEHVRETISVVVGFTAITFLHITAGEQAPKWLAIQKPLPTSLFVARPLRWFHLLSFPFIWGLNHASLWMLRRIGLDPAGEHEIAHSEEELRLLLSATRRKEGGGPLGRHLVLNAMDLHHRVAREVMRPRQEIVAMSTEASVAECLDIAEKTRYSRFPLCEGGDLDKTLGVLHIKDLFAARIRARGGRDLVPALKKIIYVPETARLEKLLHLLLERRLHLAVVVDEYGSTTGIVTLENIIEELVGQIQDEFDQEKPLVTATGEGLWEIDGSLPLHELAELVGESIQEEGIATTSGWVTRQIGGFPKDGDLVHVGGCELRVEETDGARVARLRLRRLPPDPETST